MGEVSEGEEAQLKASEFSPLGLRVFKALFALGIAVPTLFCAYGLLSYWLGRP